MNPPTDDHLGYVQAIFLQPAGRRAPLCVLYYDMYFRRFRFFVKG